MAIRYSGDVEIRLIYDPRDRLVRARVRDPIAVWYGGFRAKPPSDRDDRSRFYDRLAADAIARAEAWAARHRHKLPLDRDRRGRPIVKRVFQAACPI